MDKWRELRSDVSKIEDGHGNAYIEVISKLASGKPIIANNYCTSLKRFSTASVVLLTTVVGKQLSLWFCEVGSISAPQ